MGFSIAGVLQMLQEIRERLSDCGHLPALVFPVNDKIPIGSHEPKAEEIAERVTGERHEIFISATLQYGSGTLDAITPFRIEPQQPFHHSFSLARDFDRIWLGTTTVVPGNQTSVIRREKDG